MYGQSQSKTRWFVSWILPMVSSLREAQYCALFTKRTMNYISPRCPISYWLLTELQPYSFWWCLKKGVTFETTEELFLSYQWLPTYRSAWILHQVVQHVMTRCYLVQSTLCVCRKETVVRSSAEVVVTFNLVSLLLVYVLAISKVT